MNSLQTTIDPFKFYFLELSIIMSLPTTWNNSVKLCEKSENTQRKRSMTISKTESEGSHEY